VLGLSNLEDDDGVAQDRGVARTRRAGDDCAGITDATHDFDFHGWSSDVAALSDELNVEHRMSGQG
jgi:hypothetical protein